MIVYSSECTVNVDPVGMCMESNRYEFFFSSF